MKHSFGGELKLVTKHKSQLVLHGPVVYVEDPYAAICNAHDNWDFIVRSAFVKGIQYRDQREYRFIVLTEDKLTPQIVDLDVSLALLGAMERRVGSFAPRGLPTVEWAKDELPSDQMIDTKDYLPTTDGRKPEPGFTPIVVSGLPVTNLTETSTVPVAPSRFDATDLPENWQEVTNTYGAVHALRYAVGGPFGSNETKPELASSAWHMEPCIRRLCSIFEDPVRTIQITEDNFVVVTLNFPDGSGTEGKIAVGPLGTGNYVIKRRNGGFSASIEGEAWSLANSMEDALKEAGLPVRQPPNI